jgi:hypothetical protein
VFDSGGLPDYPPQRNAWQFPPPPISKRWKWAAIAAMVAGLVGGTALIATVVVVGSNGVPGAIDNSRLLSVIQRECDRMTSTVESMPVAGPPLRRAQTIAEQDRAVRNMVDAIRGGVDGDVIRDDEPAVDWLRDWDRLVEARETYAERLVRGSTADLEIPQDAHGEDVDVRMDDVWIGDPACEVPQVLLDPYVAEESSI